MKKVEAVVRKLGRHPDGERYDRESIRVLIALSINPVVDKPA
jgi:hypothetical protein